ncbi:hypothetical protein P7L78_21925 [Tistrella bauzanensis]|uniref:DUF6950 family protein n=1 Tax=Tistrella TaxID=171436 RepID=UPI0031F66872
MTIGADRDALLTDWIRGGAAAGWAWGALDCSIWAADWVRIVRGADPAAAWRGRYRTARGCARLIRRHPGGLAAMAADGLLSIGCLTVAPDVARPGDVGIIRGIDPARTGVVVEAIAIRGRASWITKIERGIARHDPGAAVAAWEV